MQKSMNLITNRIKKGVCENWGHPSRFEKRHTNIGRCPDVPRHRAVRRRKKNNRAVYFNRYAHCPFCLKELRIREDAGGSLYVFSEDRERFCRECGAKEIKSGCPACGYDTWVDRNGVHRHLILDCGFIGKRRERKTERQCQESNDKQA